MSDCSHPGACILHALELRYQLADDAIELATALYKRQLQERNGKGLGGLVHLVFKLLPKEALHHAKPEEWAAIHELQRRALVSADEWREKC